MSKIIEKWNSAYSQSLTFMGLAIISLFKNDMVETSLIMFGISMILIELGFIRNQNKDIISIDKKD